ncbi:membrane protein [Mycobacterium phage Saguaro]|uniref:Membrane protein n=1 Tax=Mycobacterium phage Saguaro TaxID=2315616 RepID=A0A386K9I5_9CAUD|nr:membrane protein [Mycobacterium phage Saguaro]AYD82068.1 membrane protein [Mycobacterium phage Saguaro]
MNTLVRSPLAWSLLALVAVVVFILAGAL